MIPIVIMDLCSITSKRNQMSQSLFSVGLLLVYGSLRFRQVRTSNVSMLPLNSFRVSFSLLLRMEWIKRWFSAAFQPMFSSKHHPVACSFPSFVLCLFVLGHSRILARTWSSTTSSVYNWVIWCGMRLISRGSARCLLSQFPPLVFMMLNVVNYRKFLSGQQYLNI